MRVPGEPREVERENIDMESESSREIRSMRDDISEVDNSIEIQIQPLLQDSRSKVHFLRSEFHKTVNLLVKHFSLAAYLIFRFALPLASIVFLLVQSGRNQDYYTFAQKALIVTASMSMAIGFKYCLLQRIFRYQDRSGIILFIAGVNYIVWDRLHSGDFFEIHAKNRDIIYFLNYCEFYVILMVNMFTVLAWVVILILVAIYLIWRVLSRRIKTERQKRILNNLQKLKFSWWKSQNVPRQNTSTELIGESECCICCQKINEDSFIAALPSCGHVFHHRCVFEWLTINPVCPYCRDNVVNSLRRQANISDSFGENQF